MYVQYTAAHNNSQWACSNKKIALFFEKSITIITMNRMMKRRVFIWQTTTYLNFAFRIIFNIKLIIIFQFILLIKIIKSSANN